VTLRELRQLEREVRLRKKPAALALDDLDRDLVLAFLIPDLDFYWLAEGPFSQAPKKSIDFTAMERINLAGVL
jgi:mannose-1-phosphate guanylyltransferase